MARTAMSMDVAMVLVTMLCARAMAQSDCTSVLISLSPCLNYITGNSSTPASQCCTQLASVVRSSPQCLCQVLNGGGSSLGINVNQTQAIALPGACNVQTPPISSCNGKKEFDSLLSLQSQLPLNFPVKTPVPKSEMLDLPAQQSSLYWTGASPAASPAGTSEAPSSPSGTA